MANLAAEFGVSVRTIKNDIDILSLSYPIETIRGRYGGGVRVADGYYLHKKYLKPEQQELLERLSANCQWPFEKPHFWSLKNQQFWP